MDHIGNRDKSLQGEGEEEEFLSVEVDFISRLPDEVLICHILDRLCVRDSARTSVLSTRWRYLWIRRPCLHLNIDTLFNTNADGDALNKFLDLEKKHQEEKFTSAANNIFQDGHKDFMGCLEELTIDFFWDWQHTGTIKRWIDFALSCGVNKIVITYDDKFGEPDDDTKCCNFPLQLFSEGRGSSVTHVVLDQCMLQPPQNFSGFKSLEKLYVYTGIVGDIDMETILSNCPALIRLHMVNCPKLTVFRITNSCAKLKYLNVRLCDGLTRVEISSASLFRLEYEGHVITFDIKYAPNLLVLFLEWTKAYGVHQPKVTELPDLPQVKFLVLSIPASVDAGVLRHPPFAFLGSMMLSLWPSANGDLLWVASLISAAPVLRTLRLQLTCEDSDLPQPREIRRLSEKPHKHLGQVFINGFIGVTSQIELALYILNNSTVLKLMALDYKCVYYKAGGTGELRKKPSIKFRQYWESAREMAEKYLSKEVPSGAILRIKQL